MSRPKILIARAISPEVVTVLEQHFEVQSNQDDVAWSPTELAERLQGIESALEKSLARSDEQLAYYVAQAREVIELSMLSQKQIIGQLQQLAGARDGASGA